MLTASTSFIYAQRKMPVVVLNDTMLASGTYVAENNVLITKGASLKLSPGSKILLGEGVVIRVEGGFELAGNELAFAEITSLNKEKRGLGIVVSEISEKNISLNKVRIHGLEFPLEFDQDWHRNSIEIKACEFKDNESYLPGIFVRVPESIEIANVCNFVFEGNSFIDNIGGIYFENINQFNLNVEFNDNFIYGNRFYGAGLEGMLTSPLFFRSDNEEINDNFKFKNNTLTNNFILDSEYDTVIHEVNMGVAGSASKIGLPQNYFGDESVEKNTKNLDHFSNNNNAPFINISPMLKQMPASVPPIIGDVYLNGENIGNIPQFVFEPTQNLEMEFEFDKEVDIANSTPGFHFVGLDSTTEKEVSGTLSANIEWVGRKKAIVKISDAVLGKLRIFFIKFTGIVGASQFSAPSFYFGENGYRRYMAKNYAESIKNLAKFETNRGAGPGGEAGNSPIDPAILEEILARQDSLEKLLDKMKMGENKTYEDIIEEAERQIIFAKYYKGSYEYGVFLGTSVYFGDLTEGAYFGDPSDFAPSLGLALKYNFTERVSLSTNFLYGRLQGDESNNFSGTSWQDRGFKFQSPLLELSSRIEFNLNKLGFGDQGRFTPALSIGFGAFYFNPTTTYQFNDGTVRKVSLYSLQTAGTVDPYSRVDFCVPFGFHLKSVVSKKYLLDVSVSWRYTFTDMIDDFGEPGYYRSHDYYKSLFGDQKYFPNDPTATDLKADVAFNLANSNTPEKYYREGQEKWGSTNSQDWYFVIGVTLSRIKPNEKKVKIP